MAAIYCGIAPEKGTLAEQEHMCSISHALGEGGTLFFRGDVKEDETNKKFVTHVVTHTPLKEVAEHEA